MKTNGSSKLPNAVIAFGLGVIGGAMSGLLARKETREKVLAQGSQSLDYLKEQGKKLRERSEEAVKKGRDFVGCLCHDSVNSSAEGEKQADEKETHQGMGG